MGIKYFDGKVTEKPYETGLEYDKCEKIINENGLALENIKTVKNGDKVSIQFAFANTTGVAVTDEKFVVERPATNGDIVYITPQTDGKLYKAEFPVNGYGNFVLEVRAKVAADEIALRKNFYINQ
ncbi:MAG: hypothetical protein AB7F25_01935 [Deferribacterales bacterium]